MKDIHIIEDVLSGNTNQFSFLVNRYKDLVFSINYRILENREDAEECSQDAFLKAFKKLNTFRSKSKFSTWLYKIAYHTALDFKKRKRKVHFEEIQNVAQQSNHQNEGIPQLEKAISLLDDLDKLIITLYYLEEKPVKIVSEITGLSVSNVKIRLMRTRSKLKELFNK